MVVLNDEIKNIPDYRTNDSIGDRLVALVQLEQFMDERTMTTKIFEDLMKIALIARKKNESRICNLASLIMKQSMRYIQKDGLVTVVISSKDYDMLKILKKSSRRLDESKHPPIKKYFEILSDIKNQNNHYIVKFYISSLIKSYQEHGNFSGAFAFKKKGSDVPENKSIATVY